MSYRLIVGLGNPGIQYADTRHNVGFRVIDAFAAKSSAEPWKESRKHKALLSSTESHVGARVVLAKPTTFMNGSGLSVQKLCSYFKVPPEALLVIYDEINLPLGHAKISLSGSAGGHNGVADIVSKVKPAFARLRIGIGAKPNREVPLADYVLGKFTDDEESVVAASIAKHVEGIELLLRCGPELSMSKFNRKSKSDDSNSL